jgi:sec-independent protein translocase protein TatA
MGSFSVAHWIVVALVVLVLFGRGKISETMGDFGKGVKSFRKGLSDDEPPRQPPAVPTPLAPPAQAEASAEPAKQPEPRGE